MAVFSMSRRKFRLGGSQMKSVMSCALLLFLCASAVAGDCVLKTTRTACPGKEKEAYSKCNGAASCDEQIQADSAKECAEKAIKSCDNSRPAMIKSKEVSAMFDGKPVEGGGNFCAADRADYNKCQ
jgi:hypothetical protein